MLKMVLRTRYDAVIVGGGHNGLVAASYLARAGQSVLVLERNASPGGATASARIFPGMDARLSRYAYLVSLLPRTILDDLQLPFAPRRRRIASCTPYDEDGRARALLLSNVDAAASEASLRALVGDDDWRGYRALLALEQTFARMVWPSLLQPLRSRNAWQSALHTAPEREAWEAFVERPLGATLERHVRHDLLRGVLFTDGKIGIFTQPHDATLLQNRCFIYHIIGNGTGEWQVPVGGMGALVDALTTCARAAGAEIVTGAPAEAIHPGVPRHTVVFRQGDQEHAVEATRVLVNAGPQVFAHLLDRAYAPAPGDEGSVCKVNMLLRRLPRLKAAGIDPRDAFAGTLHVDESYGQMEASYRQATARALPAQPPFELYCHTLTDDSILGPALREAGYHTLTLFGLDAPYRLFEQDHAARKAELLRRYLRGLDRILADPIEECLALDVNGEPCIEVKTPQDLERELALNQGNIFHGALSWFFAEDDDQTGTWGVETPYERIYRCGASAVRGGAVSGIPGRNAARCIFEELRLVQPQTP
ncbi:MAG TPA: NAD(P)/FAD-dependent oxidoreductase [Chloroflexota bacterium]|nr:NAD(P)/FAD-dependent oxidoreductase [Chloroflexota bacterium]